MPRPKQLEGKSSSRKKGVTDGHYKEAKRQAFVIWLQDPGLSTRKLSDRLKDLGFEVHYATVSKWINDDEWNRWYTKMLGSSFKELSIGVVKLHKKAIDFCNRALDGDLDEDESKLAGPNTKIVSMLFEHAGLISKKPFMEIHNNSLTQINNSTTVTPELLESMSTEQVTNYLTRGELPESKKEDSDEDEIIIPEDDIIKIISN